MIWQENVVEIVAMSVLDGLKCPRYIPILAKEERQFGAFKIKHNGTKRIRNAYDATMLKVRTDFL